jgi:cytochrome c7-like protein
MPEWRGILVALLTGAVAITIGSLYSLGSADSSRQDLQPVDFSHELHAGRLKVHCLFCHRHATDSPVATVPSVSLCMGCHGSLTRTTPEIDKLVLYWKQQKPIPWVRLQRIPDFVYFTHEMHLKGGLNCVDCHGRVDQVRHTPRAPAFEMGWCLACHRERRASEDCLTCHK